VSKRPIRQKKIRKLERALRKASAPAAHINLIDWLKARGHAQTTGAAVKLLLDGKVRVESHIVGRTRVPVPMRPDEEEWGIAPLVPAHHRGNITVDE
jgi:hypothetical protein